MKEKEKRIRPFRDRAVLAAVLLLFALVPCFTGVIYLHFTYIWWFLILLLVLNILLRKQPGGWTARLSLIAISLSLTLVGVDLALRPLPSVHRLFYFRPHEMYNYPCPSLPEFTRYKTNVRFKGSVYGDLAAMSGDRANRQDREVTFITDGLGFRNLPGASEKQVDLILLGDSFGMGMDTTQEKIWSTAFQEEYDLGTYSLSMPGNPWHELMNLEMELGRLKIRDGTMVLWALFGGNDLEDHYGDPGEMPRSVNIFKSFTNWSKSFRKHSVIRTLIKRVSRIANPPEYRLVTVSDLPDGGKMLFYKPYMASRDRTREEVRAHPNYPKLKSVLAAMKDFARRNALKVAVVSIPTKIEVYEWILEGTGPGDAAAERSGFSKEIQSLCRDHGFPFLDLEEDFIQEARRLYDGEKKFLWWTDDTHWNEAGHELAARVVYEKLLKPQMAAMR